MGIVTPALGLWPRARGVMKYHASRALPCIRGALSGTGIAAYWYRTDFNFGDLITPLLLRHYGHIPVYTHASHARLAAAGSILEHLPDDFSGIILGSGFILERSRMSFPKATVLALRGKLSRERAGLGPKLPLGDPGLLASEVMPKRESKKYVLGLVPHYQEKADPRFAKLLKNFPEAVALIDPQDQPLRVFSAIDRCEHILSSSLHGLIVADSLGIPNRWLGSAILWGGRFKFDDYYSGIGVGDQPVILTGEETLAQLTALAQAKPAQRINEVKETLGNLWASLHRYR